MIVTPRTLSLIRIGVLKMIMKHPYMLNWPPAHVTEVYVAIWVMDFKASVN